MLAGAAAARLPRWYLAAGASAAARPAPGLEAGSRHGETARSS